MVSQEFMNILRKQPHQNIPTTSNSATSTGNDRQPLSMQEHEGNLTLKEEKEDYDDTGQPSFEIITDQTDMIIKEEEVDDDNGFEQSLSQTMVGSESVHECDDTGQPAVKITGQTDVMIKEEEEDVSNAWKQSIKEEEENENNACKQSIKEEEENGSNAWKQSLSQTMVSRVSDTVPSSPHQASKGNEKGITVFAPELPQRLEREERTLHRPSSKRIIKKKIIFDCSDISSSKQKNQRKKTKCKVKKEILCNSGTDKHCMKTSKLLSKICGDEGRVTSRQRDDDLDCKNCKYCGRYVKREYYMRLHHMKHTGETPYKCSYCTNAYRTRWRLKQHLRTHTNDLPYHCPYCSYRGNRSDYLSSHVKRIHNKELKQSLPQEKKKGVAGSEGRKKKRKGKKFEGNTESFPPQALG